MTHPPDDTEPVAALGREIPFDPPSADRRAAVRASLLAAVTARSGSAPRRRQRLAALGVGLAAAAAIVVAMIPPPGPARPPATATSATDRPPAATTANTRPRRAAIVSAVPGARFQRLAGPPHEIVRLDEGTIEVDVEPATAGETFRVITSDGVVDVRGTIFETSASRGRLVAVRVRRGRVAVRSLRGGRQQDILLEASQQWTAPVSAPVPAAPAPRDLAERAFNEGLSLLRSQDSARAARAFERAVALAPRAPLAEDAWYWRGVALAQSGVRDEARAVLEEFLRRFPLSPRAGEASAMAGWLLLEAGERAPAAARFRDAIEDRSPRVRASARSGLDALARPPTVAPAPR